jgi:hypothetical protein
MRMRTMFLDGYHILRRCWDVIVIDLRSSQIASCDRMTVGPGILDDEIGFT